MSVACGEAASRRATRQLRPGDKKPALEVAKEKLCRDDTHPARRTRKAFAVDDKYDSPSESIRGPRATLYSHTKSFSALLDKTPGK
jgi:hypothetical protein